MTCDLPSKSNNHSRKPVVVYMDGCFDVMHLGHANALRQAKALGDILVVGVCSHSEIVRNKGPPVMSDDERLSSVRAIKWVDQIIPNIPYVLSEDFINYLLHEKGIDIIVHGDDPCLDANGEDAYKVAKELGRFRTIKRTEGVSSTDIVSRMLSCANGKRSLGAHPLKSSNTAIDHYSRSSSFLCSSRRFVQFAGNSRAPPPSDRVVYVPGAFDVFHPGHIETLCRARRLGDFLIVGVHDDCTVNQRKGSNFPIMNLHERTLMVLSCRYVDDVIIGAPWVITDDMITTLNISVVVHGTHHNHNTHTAHNIPSMPDPFAVVRKRHMLKDVQSITDLSAERILQRVLSNHDAFVKRNQKKVAKEEEYVTQHKRYIQEV